MYPRRKNHQDSDSFLFVSTMFIVRTTLCFCSNARHISTPPLKPLLALHVVPINVLVSNESQMNVNLRNGFALRCFQRLSVPNLATQRCPWQVQLVHQRFVHSGPLVLGVNSFNIQRPQQIGDRTVSRRSEPSSRTALIGEQPNPWELLHPQDAMSRHRGAKQRRRCGRLGAISLLSPE